MKEQFPGALPESNTEKVAEMLKVLETLIEQAEGENEENEQEVVIQKAQSALVLQKLREGHFDFLQSERFALFRENHGFVRGFVDALVAGGFDLSSKEKGKVHDWKTFGAPKGTQGTGESNRAEDVDR